MSRDEVVVAVRCAHRRPSVADLARMRAWLRFMRWLYRTGRLTEWPREED